MTPRLGKGKGATQLVAFRLPKVMVGRLKREARSDGRDLTSYVRKILAKHLSNTEGDSNPTVSLLADLEEQLKGAQKELEAATAAKNNRRIAKCSQRAISLLLRIENARAEQQKILAP